MIVSGGFGDREPEADLAGYHFHSDLCAALDTSALSEHYAPDPERDPDGHHAEDHALDSSHCSLRFKAPDAEDYEVTYVSFQAQWHKRSDPEGEFAARMRGYEGRSDDTSAYAVEAVEGLGDEAFLITDRDRDDDAVRWAMLSVRDGWLESSMDWSDLSSAGSEDRLSAEELKEALTSDTRTTLEALREPAEDSGPPRRGEGDI